MSVVITEGLAGYIARNSGMCRLVLSGFDELDPARRGMEAARGAVFEVDHPEEPGEPFASYASDLVVADDEISFVIDVADVEAYPEVVDELLAVVERALQSAGASGVLSGPAGSTGPPERGAADGEVPPQLRLTGAAVEVDGRYAVFEWQVAAPLDELQLDPGVACTWRFSHTTRSRSASIYVKLAGGHWRSGVTLVSARGAKEREVDGIELVGNVLRLRISLADLGWSGKGAVLVVRTYHYLTGDRSEDVSPVDEIDWGTPTFEAFPGRPSVRRAQVTHGVTRPGPPAQLVLRAATVELDGDKAVFRWQTSASLADGGWLAGHTNATWISYIQTDEPFLARLVCVQTDPDDLWGAAVVLHTLDPALRGQTTQLPTPTVTGDTIEVSAALADLRWPSEPVSWRVETLLGPPPGSEEARDRTVCRSESRSLRLEAVGRAEIDTWIVE